MTPDRWLLAITMLACLSWLAAVMWLAFAAPC